MANPKTLKFPYSKIVKTLILATSFVVICLFFRPNYAKLYDLKRHYSLLKQKLILEEKRNASLRKELNSLANDPSRIEKTAREKLGWCKSNETVYRFQSSDSKPLNRER